MAVDGAWFADKAELRLPLAIVAAILAGGFGDLVNGFIITKGRVAAFIVEGFLSAREGLRRSVEDEE